MILYSDVIALRFLTVFSRDLPELKFWLFFISHFFIRVVASVISPVFLIALWCESLLAIPSHSLRLPKWHDPDVRVIAIVLASCVQMRCERVVIYSSHFFIPR